MYDDFKSEVHISIPSIPPTSYGLRLSPLPGGTTEDYASHIHGCLDSIVKTYASYLNLDHIYAKSTVIHNLKNILSDRVAVNHCVLQSLQSALDIELLELKCNVHPLDGIAKKGNTSLKLYDTEHNIESSTFGRECCAVNFIYAMCKMRYKQEKGDPAGFKQFMTQENIKPGIIAWYVGNRFHVVIHLAGVFYYLQEKLLTYMYLDSACRNTTSL